MKIISMSLRKIKENKALIALAITLFVFRWSFADHYRVPTGSMLPTIQIGDHIFTNKMAYDLKIPFTELTLIRLSEPQRGDVVVFLYPVNPKVHFVKRLIGLPGERIKINNNKIYVNGTLLREKYLPNEGQAFHLPQGLEVDVPSDMYFMLGDNRDNSLDSRYWGFVPRTNIKGKALGVLWNIQFGGPSLVKMDSTRVGARL